MAVQEEEANSSEEGEAQPGSKDVEATVELVSLAGENLMEAVLPVPVLIGQLQSEVHAQLGIKPTAQRFLLGDEVVTGTLDGEGPFSLVLLTVDIAKFSWDIAGNPESQHLGTFEDQPGKVIFHPQGYIDYVNVLTQEPFDSGVHYVELVMEKIGDEQWVGVTTEVQQAGGQTHPGSLSGVFLYCGRRYGNASGGLQSRVSKPGHYNILRRCPKVESGSAVQLLLDVEKGAASFLVDGVYQFSSKVPSGPLYLVTCVDDRDDAVVIRQKDISDVPVDAIEGLDKPFPLGE